MSIACLIYVLMSCIANGYRSFVSTTTHCRFTCLFFTVLIIICHYYQSLFSVIVIPICVEIWLEISAPPPPLANSVIMRILSVVGRAMMRERTVYPPSNAKAKNDIAYTSYLQLPRLGPTIILFLHHQCLPNIPWRHLLPEFAWYITCNISDYRYAELCPPGAVNKGTTHSYDETTANNLKNAAHDREMTTVMVRTMPIVWYYNASQPRSEHLTPAAASVVVRSITAFRIVWCTYYICEIRCFTISGVHLYAIKCLQVHCTYVWGEYACNALFEHLSGDGKMYTKYIRTLATKSFKTFLPFSCVIEQFLGCSKY